MPTTITALNIKNAPAGNHKVETGLRYKSNGDGTGSWQCRYKIEGRDRALSLGTFPEVTLKEARERNADHRAELRRGNDPKTVILESLKGSAEKSITIKELAVLAFEDHRRSLKNGGAPGRWWSTIENHVVPMFGNMRASEITGRVIADKLRPKWNTMFPTMDKVMDRLNVILKWAAAADYEVDALAPARAKTILGKSLHKVVNVKAMDHDAVPAFYQSLDRTVSDLGLRFYIVTMPRASNAAEARWEQIEGDLWHIPAEEMKNGQPHDVPLTPEAIAILDEAAKHYDKREGYIFKNDAAWKSGHISMNNWTQRMRRAKIDATAHGMRTAFKMWATINNVASDTLVEEALHHSVRSKVELAYMRGHTAELRRPLMEKWAAFLLGMEAEIVYLDTAR